MLLKQKHQRRSTVQEEGLGLCPRSQVDIDLVPRHYTYMYIHTVISQDTSLKNTPTSHAVSLALFMHLCSDFANVLLCHALACKWFLPSFVTIVHGGVQKKKFFNKLHASAKFQISIHIWLYYKNYSVKKARVVILVSVHWPTFYILVLHAVMVVEGLTPLPYPPLALYTLA